MPNITERFIKVNDHPFFMKVWEPDHYPSAVVQVIHGMEEHCGWYDKLGEKLADNGFAAFCHDQRGHGRTVLPNEPKGYFAHRGGWDLLAKDAVSIGLFQRKRYPGIPFFLFGHSMGAMLGSDIASMGDATIYSAYILSGLPYPNPAAALGMAMAKGFSALGMEKTPNPLLNAVAFFDPHIVFQKNALNRAIRSLRSHNKSLHKTDQLSHFTFTSSGFYDLYDGDRRLGEKNWAVRTECKPFLLLSGEEDAVGGRGKAPALLSGKLRSAGRDVTVVLYPGAGHNILLDPHSENVYNDIVKWITEVQQDG